MSVVIDDSGKAKFDLRTHIINPKTGQVIRHQPYERISDKAKGTWFIRNGIRYYGNGQLHEDDARHGKKAEVTPSLAAIIGASTPEPKRHTRVYETLPDEKQIAEDVPAPKVEERTQTVKKTQGGNPLAGA